MLQSLLQERQSSMGVVLRHPATTTHTVFSATSGWCPLQEGQSLIVREVLSPKHPDLKPRADGAGRGLQAVGTPGDSGLPSRGHLQMVVLMDPMEDPDDILRAHRSREKSYLFDVAFDFTATQVRGECGLETHRKRTPLHTSPCKDSSQGTLHTFSSTLAQAHTSWSFAHL